MPAPEVGDEQAWVLQSSAVAVLDGVWVGDSLALGVWVFGSLLWAVLMALVCVGTHAVGRPPRGRAWPRPTPGGIVMEVRASVAGAPECVERRRMP